MTRQIERLRPAQIEDALAQRSLIYLPLGTIEWHCHHLPVGLDALTAHGLCLRAADVTGGLVWPTLFYGTGGDHGDFPWTVMMPDTNEIAALVNYTLRRLEAMSVKDVIIFSGHFADEQLAMIDRIANDWNAGHDAPSVRALSVNQADIAGFPPDHAGLFETTLLEGVSPGLADVEALGLAPDNIDRFDRASPLWGIVGADPRNTAPKSPGLLVEEMTEWLVAQLS